MKTAKNIALDYLRKSKNRVPVIDLDTALDMLSEDPFSDVSWILEEKEKSLGKLSTLCWYHFCRHYKRIQNRHNIT